MIPIAVGVDVGGTKIAVGTIDGEGGRAHVGTVPTTRGDGAANALAVRTLVHAAVGSRPTPVGLSVTTTVDEQGRLRDTHNWLGWSRWTAHDILDGPRGQHVVVANDALCGALAEDTLGEHAGPDSDERILVYITLGTGLAHTAVVGGRPLAGAHGGALFSGWSPTTGGDGGTPSATWEEVCAGPAIAARFDGGNDARPLARAAAAGDPRAQDILESAARHLGAYIATLVQTYDPHVLVVGGGLAHGFPDYVDRAVTHSRTFIKQGMFRATPIVRASFGADSGWLGAALLAARQSSTTPLT
jgi:glucokinase